VAKESVVLDTGWDVLAFARQAGDLAGGRIEFTTIPVSGADTNSHGDVVLVDPQEVREFVREKIGPSTAPDSGASSTPSEVPPADTVSPASVRIDVRNATGRNGLAAQVARELRSRGYKPGVQKNSDSLYRSSVHYPDGGKDAADQVARLLGGVTTEEDSNVTTGQLRVYLGSDFSISDIVDNEEDDSSSGARYRSSDSSSSSSSSAAPPPPPITADGVPCID
jgi:hypothetical protein